ncbi:MAG: SMP-30/gluconolactonase/LRE family protein [Planctomycetaceae bacterium]
MPQRILASILILLASHLAASAASVESLRPQRKEVFEFTEAPAVVRDGDRFTITFASKDYCDATVAVEDRSGRIIRHLASGVLGKNAPEPFRKDSLRQSLEWDGKNDQGRYVDDLDGVTVRVSLGLKPRFERTMLWSPHRRHGGMPVLAVGPEGAYVHDGRGIDLIRQYDHEGNYVQSVYPFPHDKLDEVQGLNWHDFPQGYKLPLKGGLYQHTLLTSGSNWHTGNHAISRSGVATTTMSVRGDRLALAFIQVNRLALDGSTGGLPLSGARVGHSIKSLAGPEVDVGPASSAFSPDGKTLYLTGYMWRTGSWNKAPGCYHMVYKVDYEKDDPPTIFKGDMKEHGDGEERFRVPTSVATDSEGRVYVSDFLNNRVQVFDAAGSLLRTIPVKQPARVCIHEKTGEIWVFSYPVVGVPYDLHKRHEYQPEKVEQALTRFSPMPEPKQLSREPFPLGYADSSGFEYTGHLYRVELDSWADEPAVWVVGRKHEARGEEFGFSGGYAKNDQNAELWKAGVRLQKRVDGEWKVVRSFGVDTEKKVKRAAPPRHNVQRLIVNPVTGKLYVAEPDSAPTIKAANDWIEIDPEKGDKSIDIIPMPFNGMEGAFDLDGRLYLRNTDSIARYTFPEFKEVPWDYGEEDPRLGNDGSIYGRSTSVVAALKMPSTSPVCYHQGGFAIAPNGDVVVSCAYRFEGISSGHRANDKEVHHKQVYEPRMYPGRASGSTTPCIHVWDQHGRLKVEDAIPGVGQCDGIGIDGRGDIYVMQAPTIAIDGKRYFNHMSQTLMKVRPGEGRGKVISSSGSPIQLGDAEKPNRPPDLVSTRHGEAWVEGAEWMYGGVGFAGFNMIGHGGGCACWFSRFELDHFARSIAPEPDQYRVAVVDSAGNLILRIGQYGNVDDGVPLIAEDGPPNTRSIGGDEVALMHACFVGTHTDRRIFVSDVGNQRIVSVKLGYHTEKRVPLE